MPGVCGIGDGTQNHMHARLYQVPHIATAMTLSYVWALHYWSAFPHENKLSGADNSEKRKGLFSSRLQGFEGMVLYSGATPHPTPTYPTTPPREVADGSGGIKQVQERMITSQNSVLKSTSPFVS